MCRCEHVPLMLAHLCRHHLTVMYVPQYTVYASLLPALCTDTASQVTVRPILQNSVYYDSLRLRSHICSLSRQPCQQVSLCRITGKATARTGGGRIALPRVFTVAASDARIGYDLCPVLCGCCWPLHILKHIINRCHSACADSSNSQLASLALHVVV